MPQVSIILPTFNRARFLPEAFATIEAQTWRNWELIVVDDGSDDDTKRVVGAWSQRPAQRVRYVYQENRGAYGARNTGLDHATGEYIAFFDSDDLWLPHHLERCVTALQSVPDVDWVYAPCRSIDSAGLVVQETTFETPTGPLPFRSLGTRKVGDLYVIEDPTAIECHLGSGMYAGLQNSVIRREVFDGYRFWEGYRVVEDAVFLLRAMVRGVRLGYLLDVHVIYRIHEGNSSASASTVDTDALYRIRMENVIALKRVQGEVTLTRSQQRALRRCLARTYFWDLGYACLLRSGKTSSALKDFRRGLSLTPGDFRMWKTYLATVFRSVFDFT